MRIKIQAMVNGVAQTIFADPLKDWVAIQFSQEERQAIALMGDGEAFIAAPRSQLKTNREVVMQWASEWPTRFFSGTHRQPEGSIILPDGKVKDQTGN
jgi:hypothetical protein